MRPLIYILKIILLIIGFLLGQDTKGFILPQVDTSKHPWLGISSTVRNSADFNFAIVADRTGGMQSNVFEEAVKKLNLLRPDFVISIGDLIDGYTMNENLAHRQWDEFDAIVRKLDRPFFYLPGNHDVSNALLTEIWEQRLGPLYYHFIYDNCLFLCLNTEEGSPYGISEKQITYFGDVLQKYKKVRWIFVFMHRPLWDYDQKYGYERIASFLTHKRFSLFSGHHHHYVKKIINNNAHYVLGTTGGGSDLRGAEFGELHHIMWVSFGNDGPRIANLELNGIYDDGLVVEDDYGLVVTLRHGKWFNIEPLVHDQHHFTVLQSYLEFSNRTAKDMRVTGNLDPQPGLLFSPENIDLTVPAGSHYTLPVNINNHYENLKIANLSYIPFTLKATFIGSKGQELTLSATKKMLVDWLHDCPATIERPYIDACFDDWPNAKWIEVDKPQYIREDWDWKGADDGYFRFATAHDDQFLFIALQAVDDRILFGSPELIDRQDHFIVYLQDQPSDGDVSVFNEGALIIKIAPMPGEYPPSIQLSGMNSTEIQFACRAIADTIKAELAVPKRFLPHQKHGFRLNVAYMDHDNPDNVKPSVLYWRPQWGSSMDYVGSGMFIFK